MALKVLKAGMDTREVLARFEAERQALAMMDHPNVCRVLDAGETPVDGCIDPGHVSTIIGEVGYRPVEEKYPVPQVIAGFEPLDVLFAVVKILQQLEDGRGEIENEYTRAVRPEGNPQALELMYRVFKAVDAPWRGIGVIPESGLDIREDYLDHDATERIDIDETYEMPHGCRCREDLRAIIYPQDCPLFNTECTPERPVGPCMVSTEASCFIAAKYGGEEFR